MAGIFLVRADTGDAAQDVLDRACAEFTRQGFALPSQIEFPGWRMLHFGYVQGGGETLLARGDDFAAVAGTLVYDGKLGMAALEGVLDGLDPLAPDWSKLAGQFLLVVRKQGRTVLLTDYFGTLQLFHDANNSVFSTSFLATALALPSVRFDAQGLYEFAFNVMPIGEDTVLEGVKTLAPTHVVELLRDSTANHPLSKPLPEIDSRPLEARLSENADALANVIAPYVAAFGDNIFSPLSGGLDSRLLLATLRAAGASPNLYVYGPESSPDVRIALSIGAAEGLKVEHIDKWGAEDAMQPEAFAAQVARNFHAFDALPTYGNIFDDGANLRARDARHAGGALAASGGCGEIYRNFFFLPDRPVSAQTVTSTFFAQFDARDATQYFDRHSFLGTIARKIGAAVGEEDGARPIARARIEHIYPRVRCRALFGREIGLEGRQSPYLMPFLDQHVASEAMRLPLALKNAGRFEAMLLNHIDPKLARHMSAYGHDFAGPPNLRHRFDEWSTRLRPAWLRQASYAIKRSLRPMADEHGGLLATEYMGRVVDLEFPHMRRYFNVDRIGDSGLWRRIACLEYLAAHLGSRLRLPD